MLRMLPVPGVFVAGVILFLGTAWDAFESIILPRRVTRRFRFTRLYFRTSWASCRMVARLFPTEKSRQAVLGVYGPISLLVLVGLWAIGLVFSFGMMQYGAGSAVSLTQGSSSFMTDIYLSGTTFFTLGLGDVVPRSSFARFLVVAEGGFGFGFLAAVIGYLPFIYSSFGQREINISLLDSRAGTPPTAGELLRRHSSPTGQEALRELLKDWERWSAELLESHLSYPVLAYFRSQHDNQSWLGALTAILDSCSVVISMSEGPCHKQAELTFAIARHAVVDLSQVFLARPRELPTDRLPPAEFDRLRAKLVKSGMLLNDSPETRKYLNELRRMYEPYVFALSEYLGHLLPPWLPATKRRDNWQTTAWARSAGLVSGEAEAAFHDDEHF